MTITKANASTKKAKDQLRAVKASQKLAAESADKGKKKVKNEKTARIAAERRAKLHAERAVNANHNAWLDKKVSLEILELQHQTAESEREKAEAASKKERQTAASILESEQKKVKPERKKVSRLEFLRSSLEHFHEDKLAEITERHQIEYSKEKRALQDKFERKYLLLHSKLQDKNKGL